MLDRIALYVDVPRKPRSSPMNGKLHLIYRTLMLLVIGYSCAVALGCKPPKDIEIAATESRYIFEPTSIQQAIAADKHELFQFEWERDIQHIGAETRSPELFRRPTVEPGAVAPKWTEVDFETTVNAFAKQTAKDSLNSFKLVWIMFYTPCQYGDLAPLSISFQYEKEAVIGGFKRYVRRDVTVDIESKRLVWRETVLADIYNEKQRLDRTLPYISAESALATAESSGGTEFRRRSQNQCAIRGYLRQTDSMAGWRIEYAPPESSLKDRFEVQVDIKTGKSQVTETPQP